MERVHLVHHARSIMNVASDVTEHFLSDLTYQGQRFKSQPDTYIGGEANMPAISVKVKTK